MRRQPTAARQTEARVSSRRQRGRLSAAPLQGMGVIIARAPPQQRLLRTRLACPSKAHLPRRPPSKPRQTFQGRRSRRVLCGRLCHMRLRQRSLDRIRQRLPALQISRERDGGLSQALLLQRSPIRTNQGLGWRLSRRDSSKGRPSPALLLRVTHQQTHPLTAPAGHLWAIHLLKAAQEEQMVSMFMQLALDLSRRLSPLSLPRQKE